MECPFVTARYTLYMLLFPLRVFLSETSPVASLECVFQVWIFKLFHILAVSDTVNTSSRFSTNSGVDHSENC